MGSALEESNEHNGGRWNTSRLGWLLPVSGEYIHVPTLFPFRPCQIGILLSVNSSLTNLGTYSQKHTNRKRKHKYFKKTTIEKKTLS